MKRVLRFVVAAGLVLAAAAPAAAHRVSCFAAADGDAVSGYAWMGRGEPARNVPYRVLAPGGEVLHEGVTDEDGAFSFVPVRECGHEVVVEAGEGHAARFTVRAEDLPAGLRPAGAVAPASPAPLPGGAGCEPAPPEAPGWEAALRRAVSREVAPLRRELAEFRGRQRVQDAVAGLGYLAGLAGAAFFFLGARRRGN